eukprot:TRINITY_DN2892_c0_g1_i2.p1 TRINITY_DN2892_c0_g1~~TRINITY_DN2892_c0_g1_i2.p1  ORF type:complete len:294 (+),score=99.78 TRINITY_DN2892_c0_g1_i2:402-1283(+)
MSVETNSNSNNALDFLAIGHITKDLVGEDSFQIGGTVTFSALAAAKFGYRSGIATAASQSLCKASLFEPIHVCSSPTTELETVFENIYLPHGRKQYVRSVAPVISASHIPHEWLDTPIVHIGPVAQEIAHDVYPLFSNSMIGITPQGYMRDWNNKQGQVNAIEWADASLILPKVSAVIVSNEDLPGGERSASLLKLYSSLCPVVVCTLGPKGCQVFHRGSSSHVAAFPATEVDPTGAGDVFAASFLLKLKQTSDPLAAAEFANAAAACNIEHPGAAGLPSLEQVQARLSQPRA